MIEQVSPPFRADHVGSLLRPPALLEARARHAAGELDDEALREVEDAAIRDVVGLQRDAGLQTATDGEFRRTSWHMDFIYQLGGRRPRPTRSCRCTSATRRASSTSSPPRCACTTGSRWSDTIFGDAFAFLRDTRRPAARRRS